ncbi:hypothetical protein ACQWU4_03210 [Chryseobacterium sp. MIQD13]|uniref:hypothetical protein n=1 Tax=Chryseobacterium sp. MIQD13 TaxID=3422310 RepID=UPI003D2A6E31
MTNNLNLLTISEFIGTHDPSLDKDIVTLIDDFTGELVNFRKDNTIPTDGKFLYFTKTNSDNSLANYRRMHTGHISVKISGASGDGNTNDYYEIQKLIDEMETGQVLNLENKRYMLFDTLHINKSIKIIGSATKDKDNPPFLITHNNDGIVVNARGVVLEGFGIYNIESYVETPNNFTGIKINGNSDVAAYEMIVRDISIHGYKIGLEVNYLWSSQIQTLKTGNCQIGILVKGKSVNNEISGNTSLSFDFNTLDSKGIWFLGENEEKTEKEGWRIIDTLIYGAYDAIYAEKTSHVNLMNSMIDFCQHIGIVMLDGCYNWNINSNYIALDKPGYGIYSANNIINPMVRGHKIINNDILIYDNKETDVISIGIDIVGSGSLYDDVIGNSVKNFKVHDIRAYEGLKTTISNNKCLSAIEPNIVSNFITNDNLGNVYYQNLNDSFHLGKVKITYADAYPTTSSSQWKRGDIILNVGPAVDAPIGWVNTTDGTNTWKQFGIITA